MREGLSWNWGEQNGGEMPSPRRALLALSARAKAMSRAGFLGGGGGGCCEGRTGLGEKRMPTLRREREGGGVERGRQKGEGVGKTGGEYLGLGG